MRHSNIPTIEELRQYDVNRRGENEVIRQSLYDFQTYAQAGQTQLQFFQIPKGQNSKTIADTNMVSAGQLPQPQNFLVESIEILFFPGVEIGQKATSLTAAEFSNDMYDFIKGGSLDFFIGSKSYLTEAPLGRFPPKTKLSVQAAFAVDVVEATAEGELISDYAAAVGRPYYLDPPALLVPNQNFNISLNWSSAVALSAAARVGVVLDGILYRQSQ